MKAKSKQRFKQESLYLGIFLAAALIAVFIFGATYGGYLKTTVPVYPNDTSPEGACVWTQPTTCNEEACSAQTQQYCQILTSKQCSYLNQPSPSPMPGSQPSSHYPGHTCEEHGFPTPPPEPPILIPVPFPPAGPPLFASTSPTPTAGPTINPFAPTPNPFSPTPYPSPGS